MSKDVEVKNYITEEVEEKLYAGSDTISGATTEPEKVVADAIPGGYDGVAVSIALTQDADVVAWLKVKGKQHYDNGLNSAGLGAGDVLAGETLLLVKLGEKAEWELSFTNTAVGDKTVAWRLRIRLFKKK